MGGLFRAAIFGVDLGGGSLKVAQLKGRRVTLATYIDIPHNIMSDEARLIGTLRDFLKGIGVSGRPAIVQFPGNLAFVRAVSFPPMPHAELKEAVKWEVKRQLPYPTEEAVYDYVATAVTDGISVIFAGAQRKNIQSYLLPFKEAGLNVIAIDISPLCLIRALKPSSAGNTIMLDIGAVSTEINILKAGILRLTRTVDIGGNFIIQSLTTSAVGKEEAERLLREGDEELKEPLEEFLKETLRSMDYYQANFKEKTFSEVILTGGVAINPAVGRFFSHALDILVSVPDPFIGLQMADETIRSISPRFSVAIGLARRTN
ncbi:MAG: pilus assembly protein PilM [Nitrospirae bacterium]|nr:pilus assembly protein PilM [Nitrospirota bacterium]